MLNRLKVRGVPGGQGEDIVLITQELLQCFKPREWLNDATIRAYALLVVTELELEHAIQVLDSQWFRELTTRHECRRCRRYPCTCPCRACGSTPCACEEIDADQYSEGRLRGKKAPRVRDAYVDIIERWSPNWDNVKNWTKVTRHSNKCVLDSNMVFIPINEVNALALFVLPPP